MRSLGSSLLIVAVVVIGLGVLGAAFGFEVSIVSSLVISLALTLVLNLVLNGFRRNSWR